MLQLVKRSRGLHGGQQCARAKLKRSVRCASGSGLDGSPISPASQLFASTQGAAPSPDLLLIGDRSLSAANASLTSLLPHCGGRLRLLEAAPSPHPTDSSAEPFPLAARPSLVVTHPGVTGQHAARKPFSLPARCGFESMGNSPANVACAQAKRVEDNPRWVTESATRSERVLAGQTWPQPVPAPSR